MWVVKKSREQFRNERIKKWYCPLVSVSFLEAAIVNSYKYFLLIRGSQPHFSAVDILCQLIFYCGQGPLCVL